MFLGKMPKSRRHRSLSINNPGYGVMRFVNLLASTLAAMAMPTSAPARPLPQSDAVLPGHRLIVNSSAVALDYADRRYLITAAAGDTNLVFVAESLNQQIEVLDRFTGPEVAKRFSAPLFDPCTSIFWNWQSALPCASSPNEKTPTLPNGFKRSVGKMRRQSTKTTRPLWQRLGNYGPSSWVTLAAELHDSISSRHAPRGVSRG